MNKLSLPNGRQFEIIGIQKMNNLILKGLYFILVPSLIRGNMLSLILVIESHNQSQN